MTLTDALSRVFIPLATAAVATVALAALYVVVHPSHETIVPPPTPGLSGTEPAVARAILSARADVLERPASAEAWGKLAMVLHVHDYLAESRVCYEQAARLAPEDARWPYLHGVTLGALEAEQAIPFYNRALELAPDAVAIRVNLGRAMLATGQTDEAHRHFQKAARRDSTCAHAWLGWAEASLASNDVKAALDALQSALQHGHEVGAVYAMLAAVYRRLGDAQAAESAAMRAAERPAESPLRDFMQAALVDYGVSAYWHGMRGANHFQAGRYDRAAAEYALAAAAQPGIPTYHFNLGESLARIGNLDEAAKAFEKGLDLAPRNAREHNRSGVILCQLGRLEDGLLAFRRAVDSATDSGSPVVRNRAEKIDHASDLAHAYFNIWLTLLELGRIDEGVAALREGVTAAPDDVLLAATLAWILATHPDSDVRDAEEALRQAETACRLSERRDPHALASLAAALAESGRFEEAVDTINLAATLNDANPMPGMAEQLKIMGEHFDRGEPIREFPQ
jgi:tetratricopeptide (TPR) repeat protein